MKTFPRAVRGLPPFEHPSLARIERRRADGLPDGIHTGGAWTDGVMVWKPLDGGNAHDGDHEETREAECLEEMAGVPGFPRNWWVETHPVLAGDTFHPRRWLVRPWCLVAGTDDLPWGRLEAEVPQFVETAMRALNAKGWELGDSIPTLAFDPNAYEYLLLDLSCAWPSYRVNDHWDDQDRFMRWLDLAGYGNLRRFREAGRHVVTSLETHERYDIPCGWAWVYASRNRPLSLSWAHRLRDAVRLVPSDEKGVHTWAVAEGPLPEGVVFDYELTLAWWPWETPASKEKR